MSTSLALAVPAHADNATDFLAMLAAGGFNAGQTPADVEITIGTGEAVCQFIHYGYSREVAARQVPYMIQDATPSQSVGFVRAAEATLCAGMYTPLVPGGN